MLQQVLANVAAAAAAERGDRANPAAGARPEKRIQLVLITSDRGLAGAFNSNLIKAAQRFIDEHPDATIELELIGRKGRDFFRKRTYAITGEHIGMFAQACSIADAAAIARKVIERFANDEIDAVYLIYNEFKSVMAQKLTVDAACCRSSCPQRQSTVDYIYEQPPEELLAALLPRTSRCRSTARCSNRPPPSMPRA